MEKNASTISISRNDIAIKVLVFVLPVVVIALAKLICTDISYCRWDNFEGNFTIVAFAHKQILSGNFPHWNPHQFLGEPIHAQAQAGTFYFPYTVCVFIVTLLGLDDSYIPFICLLLHLPFAGLGFYLLLLRMKTRKLFALVASITALSGGFLVSMASVWIFIIPLFTWMPWILKAILGMFEERLRPRELSGVVIGLTALTFIGYIQMMVYQWLSILLFSCAYALVVSVHPKRLFRVISAMAIAALLSSPALIPTYDLLQYTVRSQRMDLSTFLAKAVDPVALLGAILPVYGIKDGFMNPPYSVMLHMGAWLVPVLIIGIIACVTSWQLRSANHKQALPAVSDESFLVKLFIVTLSVALLFILLSLGQSGLIYPLTYGLPFWSSFRWPFKLLIVVSFFLPLAGGLALEICARLVSGKFRLIASFMSGSIIAAIALLLLTGQYSRNLWTAASVLCIATSIPLMLIAGLVSLYWARVSLVVLSVIQAVAMVALSHSLGFKTYKEPYGVYGPEQLGISKDYRILPMTVPELTGLPPAMQEYGILASATANGYYSATGVAWGMTPVWVDNILQSNVFGQLPPTIAAQLLPSNLLRSLNIGYVVAGKDDYQARSIIDMNIPRLLPKGNGNIRIYKIEDALPRAYFASNAFNETPIGFFSGMIENKAPLRSAFVNTQKDNIKPGILPEGQIIKESWTPNRINLSVEAPEGGLLVISQTWYPDWVAKVDGKKIPVIIVNGAVQGVSLPVGARQVVLEYISRPLYFGLSLGAAGLLLLSAWLYKLKVSSPFTQKDA